MNEEEELLNVEQEKRIDNKKLMKKSLRMIISFFTLFIVCLVLFIILQTNKFFIFNLNRDFTDTTNPQIAVFFSSVFEIIILVALVIYIVLAIRFFKRRKQTQEEQDSTIKSYEKLYSVADIFSVIPIFLIIVMVINGFFFAFATVHQCSMYPTYCPGDQVIIKYVDEYNVGDIVIVEHDGTFLIKRLVAKEGTTLTVNSTGVYFNNDLYEPIMQNGDYFYYDSVEIPDGYYYLMGDNRGNSNDSRTYGLFRAENMIGIVVYDVTQSSTCNTCSIF